MEFNETFPHKKFLGKVGIMRNMRRRFNERGEFLGIDLKTDDKRRFIGELSA